MRNEDETPETTACPYCGAGNPLDNELCGVCFKNLRIPAEVRAEAKLRKFMLGPAPAAVARVPRIQAPAAARLWGRALIIAGLLLFYLRWLKKDNYFSPLDFVNLAFHEAGHLILGFFPRFIMVLAGSLFQLLVPAVCLVHLMRRGANLGWQLCLFWIGENLLNISIYAGDAIKQELPLVGGGVHDWTYLLSETHLIAHPAGVARVIFLAGSAVILWSFYLIARDALNREPFELGDTRR